MKRASVVWVSAVIAAVLSMLLLAGIAVVWRSSRAIRTAAEDVRAEQESSFVIQPAAPAGNPGFEPVSAPQSFLQAAQFGENLYVAGPAGLLELDSKGAPLRRFSVGSELPASPLVAVAPALLADTREPELLIATSGAGLLAFDGRTIRNILPDQPEVRSVTAILPVTSGHLLFGTRKRGVLIYDGKKMSVFHPLLAGIYVTALAGSESDFWVGTLDRGVLHFHAGEVETFAAGQGLPDPQVQSLAISGTTSYVGTANGVAVFNGARFSRVLAPGVLATALLATPDLLYVGSEDQGVIPIPLQGRRPNPNAGQGGELLGVRQLLASGDAVLAVTRDGIYRRSSHAFAWQRVLESGGTVLTDRNISALATDANGQLWIGYFDRGLDLLSSDNARVRHVEDEHVFCVNRILAEAKNGTIDVATANGLVRFDRSGAEQQILTRADGLIADHVTDVANYQHGLALATPAGLTFLDASGARSMYAFHGLVSNHVYSLGVSGDELMAGTLGGLSQLQQGDVRVNYTTSSSNLKHNWITAVARVGSEWMVGTYGAGVLGLDAAGHFHTFETASGAIEINPNAMLVRRDYVLAGSLGQGIYFYDRELGRWSVIREGLPSMNVTAFSWSNGYVYVGTDNGLVRIAEQKLHP